MDSLASLMSNTNLVEPPEVAVIKRYIEDTFNMTVSVLVQDKQIVICASSGALAGSLRPRLFELQKICKTTKKLIVRIVSS